MNRSDIQRLQAARGFRAVSIYAPTHRSHPDNQQDPVRVRNLGREAKERLALAACSAGLPGRRGYLLKTPPGRSPAAFFPAATRRDAAWDIPPTRRGSPRSRLGADAAIACPCRVTHSIQIGQEITSFVHVKDRAWTPRSFDLFRPRALAPGGPPAAPTQQAKPM
ncbi:hypothetical protein BH23GEM3_BH23GEM3_21010 [soil metagenome]